MPDDATITAHRDQVDAAARDAEKLIKDVVAQDPDSFQDGEAQYTPAEVLWSSYVGSVFKWVDDTSARKRLTFCNHASFTRPSIFVIATNRPNHVDCLPCGSRRWARYTSKNSYSCEMCGSNDPQVADSMMQMGNFLACTFLCPDCKTEQERSIEILQAQWDEENKEQNDAEDD